MAIPPTEDPNRSDAQLATQGLQQPVTSAPGKSTKRSNLPWWLINFVCVAMAVYASLVWLRGWPAPVILRGGYSGRLLTAIVLVCLLAIAFTSAGRRIRKSAEIARPLDSQVNLSGVSSPTTATTPDPRFELLKLEYEKGIERFENLYQAVWQNFNYLSVVSGGILALGFNELSSTVLPFLVLTPLVFWFLGEFLPMDFYGQQARFRLGKIEEQINSTYFPGQVGLRHFRDFAEARYRWRVGEVVRLVGTFATICWVCSVVFASVDLYRRAISDINVANPLSVRVRYFAASVQEDSAVIALSQLDSLRATIVRGDSSSATQMISERVAPQIYTVLANNLKRSADSTLIHKGRER